MRYHRTTCADTGVPVGVLVCPAGVSADGRSLARETIVEAQSWEEFQSRWLHPWLERHFAVRLAHEASPLADYTAPTSAAPLRRAETLPGERRARVQELVEKWGPLGTLIDLLAHQRAERTARLTLPLQAEVLAPEAAPDLPPVVLWARGFRELLDALVVGAREGIAEFEAADGGPR